MTAWRGIFITAGVVAVATYLVYQIFGSAEVQPWNNPDASNANDAETASMMDTNDENKHKDEEKNNPSA